MASAAYVESRLAGTGLSNEVQQAAQDIYFKADGTLGAETDLFLNRVPLKDADGVVTGYAKPKDQPRSTPYFSAENPRPASDPKYPGFTATEPEVVTPPVQE